MEWDISRRSPYRDEVRLVVDDGFLAIAMILAGSEPMECRLFLLAASISVHLALAPSSTAPEVTLCC